MFIPLHRRPGSRPIEKPSVAPNFDVGAGSLVFPKPLWATRAATKVVTEVQANCDQTSPGTSHSYGGMPAGGCPTLRLPIRISLVQFRPALVLTSIVLCLTCFSCHCTSSTYLVPPLPLPSLFSFIVMHLRAWCRLPDQVHDQRALHRIWQRSWRRFKTLTIKFCTDI